MKKEVFYGVIIVLLAILAVEGGIYLFKIYGVKDDNYYMNNSNSDKNDSYKDSDKNNDSSSGSNQNGDKKIVLTASEVEELLKKVPYLTGGLVDRNSYDDAYKGTLITNRNINKNILLASAYFNSKPYEFVNASDAPLIKNQEGYNGVLASYYFKKDVIQNYIKDNFNVSMDGVPTEVFIPGGKFFLQDDYYMVVMGAGAGKYFRQRYSYDYEVEGNDVVVTEKVLFVKQDENSCYQEQKCGVYNVYKNTSNAHDNENKVGTLEENVDFNFDSDYEKIILKNNKYNPVQFKHVFKKGNNGYYWYSSEQI